MANINSGRESTAEWCPNQSTQTVDDHRETHVVFIARQTGCFHILDCFDEIGNADGDYYVDELDSVEDFIDVVC